MSFIRRLAPLFRFVLIDLLWTACILAGPTVGAGTQQSVPISSPITLEYKRVNNVPLKVDVYPVGDHLVTNVSESCLKEIVRYCPKSYDSDPTCSECIGDHQIHIKASGCPQDLYLIQNFYCSTMPNGTVDTGGKRTGTEHRGGSELRPLLIYIHGGGWSHESKEQVPDYVRQLAEAQRYVLASIEYRLTSQAEVYGGDEAVIWPAQRDDCMDAVRVLHEKAAQYGADNQRMACIGTSAGGQLCSVTAAYGRQQSTTTSLKLAAPLYGPTNLVNMTLDIDPSVGCRIDHDAVGSFESRLLGSAITNISVAEIRHNLQNASQPWPRLVALANSANAVNFVDKSTPPMFLAHGTRDGIVPYEQTQRLVAALQTAGVRHAFAPAVGCDHASEPRDCWQDAVNAAQLWITDNL